MLFLTESSIHPKQLNLIGERERGFNVIVQIWGVEFGKLTYSKDILITCKPCSSYYSMLYLKIRKHLSHINHIE